MIRRFQRSDDYTFNSEALNVFSVSATVQCSSRSSAGTDNINSSRASSSPFLRGDDTLSPRDSFRGSSPTERLNPGIRLQRAEDFEDGGEHVSIKMYLRHVNLAGSLTETYFRISDETMMYFAQETDYNKTFKSLCDSSICSIGSDSSS